MNRVQRLERKRMYIRHILELNKVHTHSLKHFIHSSSYKPSLPFLVVDFIIKDFVTNTTSVTTQRGFHSYSYRYRDEALVDLSVRTHLTDDLSVINIYIYIYIVFLALHTFNGVTTLFFRNLCFRESLTFKDFFFFKERVSTYSIRSW